MYLCFNRLNIQIRPRSSIMSYISWLPFLFMTICYIAHESNAILLCPNPVKIDPCICNYNYVLSTKFVERHFDCRSLMSPEDLERALNGAQGVLVKELKIEGSFLRYIAKDTFKEIQIKNIAIYHSSIQALSDSDIAFQGLENSLTDLMVENVSFVNDWDWNKLSGLKKLKRIYIGESDLLFLTDSFKNLPKTLEVIVLYKNPLADLAEGIFEPFTDLNIIKIQRNQIETLKRNIFPKPATKLTFLDLSNNILQTLPSDIFSDMPALQTLDLSGNLITTLEQPVFEKILPQLKEIYIKDSVITCDCRILWLVQAKLHRKMEKVICNNPPNVKGTALSQLKTNDLWC